jgi:hypothetical protein
MKIDGPTTARTVANPNPSGRRKVGVPNKMSSARVERALREGKRLPPENLLLVGADSPLSLPKTRFEHSDGVVRQGLNARQCLRTVRRAVCRAVASENFIRRSGGGNRLIHFVRQGGSQLSYDQR